MTKTIEVPPKHFDNKKLFFFIPLLSDTKVEQKIKNSFLFSALRAIETATGSFFITYPARICPRFPGKCSAHRALDFLRKSLG